MKNNNKYFFAPTSVGTFSSSFRIGCGNETIGLVYNEKVAALIVNTLNAYDVETPENDSPGKSKFGLVWDGFAAIQNAPAVIAELQKFISPCYHGTLALIEENIHDLIHPSDRLTRATLRGQIVHELIERTYAMHEEEAEKEIEEEAKTEFGSIGGLDIDEQAIKDIRDSKPINLLEIIRKAIIAEQPELAKYLQPKEAPKD